MAHFHANIYMKLYPQYLICSELCCYRSFDTINIDSLSNTIKDMGDFRDIMHVCRFTAIRYRIQE